MRYRTRLALALLALVATVVPAWSAPLYYGSVYGSFYIGNYGPQSSGCLAGQSSPHVDVPFSLTCGIPAKAPLNLFLTVEVDGSTYGNIDVSPGFVETDAGGTAPTARGGACASTDRVAWS